MNGTVSRQQVLQPGASVLSMGQVRETHAVPVPLETQNLRSRTWHQPCDHFMGDKIESLVHFTDFHKISSF